MQNNYNINQTVLSIATDWESKENHPARFINYVVEDLAIKEPYIFGRPREYDLSVLLKLLFYAYSQGIFSSRRISQLAEESLPARWLTQEQFPSYRTICRFRVADTTQKLLDDSLVKLTKLLRVNGLIDEVSFIDGTKILADANKYSFVWRKNTIRFDRMNRAAILELLAELKDAQASQTLPKDTDLSLETLDEVITRLETQLEDLNHETEETKTTSPNPLKQKRRHFKSLKRKLTDRKDKMAEHQQQMATYGQRNSYSKTDHDATFMRVKEDPMLNGQLKPAYNLQIATNHQFITAYSIFQNPGDTKTLIPFIQQQLAAGILGKVIVADAGYGSEPNYREIEDNFPDHTALIPYGTMLKENSRKWLSDDRKVMNWDYHDQDDYYIDPLGVRFDFKAYRTRTDKKTGFQRQFKEYEAEKCDNNHQLVPEALTKGGRVRKININEDWEYFKAKERELLSEPNTAMIYARRKIDVESVFGQLKACLRFTRFSVRGIKKVRKEAGIALMALNIRKLVAVITSFYLSQFKNRSKSKNHTIFDLLLFNFGTYVTAPFSSFPKTNQYFDISIPILFSCNSWQPLMLILVQLINSYQ